MIQILREFGFAPIVFPINQSGHNFAHVTTTLMSEHVQTHHLIRSFISSEKEIFFVSMFLYTDSETNPSKH